MRTRLAPNRVDMMVTKPTTTGAMVKLGARRPAAAPAEEVEEEEPPLPSLPELL